jgi:Protein of unknown function (DUF2934)
MKSKQSIAELAYQLWSARGRPHGSEAEDWLEAERQLAAASESDQPGTERDGAPDGAGKEPRTAPTRTAPNDIGEG